MDGVRARALRPVFDEGRRSAAHVGQEEVGSGHVRDRVPGIADAALVAETRLLSGVGIEMPAHT